MMWKCHLKYRLSEVLVPLKAEAEVLKLAIQRNIFRARKGL